MILQERKWTDNERQQLEDALEEWNDKRQEEYKKEIFEKKQQDKEMEVPKNA